MMTPVHEMPPEIIFRENITGEIFFALGFSREGFMRRAFGWLFRKPTGHFGKVVAKMEAAIAIGGLPEGARSILDDFALASLARGQEHFPAQGPVLVVCNHIGAYDPIAIACHIQRQDLTFLVSDVPFLRSLPQARRHYVFVPTDANGRMAALRGGIEHLQKGGALLVYAHGEVEPDPELMPDGANQAISEWSPSIEIMLRKVPSARLQVVIASGMILPRYLNHPVTRLRRQPFHRQKLAEVLQILSQMTNPGKDPVTMHVSFARPLMVEELGEGRLMPAVITAGQALLREHLQAFNLNSVSQTGG
jgi:1-acyl-sn-glycerol-3-phosphate acyltransferase